MTKELTCICCPIGCTIDVTIEGEEVLSVSGNSCKRGDVYARKEVTHPTRVVTTSVRVINGVQNMVSVKTKEDIPKDKIFDCLAGLRGVTVKAPVKIGDVIVENIADTNVSIVATKNVDAKA